MRFYTTSEQRRRILGWVGIAAAALYAAFCVEEYVRTSASTAWWPVVLFWLGVTAFSVRALLTPRDYAAIDLTTRVVRVVRRGALTRELPLGHIAPLEVYEYVPVKQTKFSVRYGVRSQPVADVMLGDDALASKAERRLAKLGERLGLSTVSSVAASPDLNADGTAKWIDMDHD